jgi:hypothetical protein
MRPSAGAAGTELPVSSPGARVVPARTALVVFTKCRRSIAVKSSFAPRILPALRPIFDDSSWHWKTALGRTKTWLSIPEQRRKTSCSRAWRIVYVLGCSNDAILLATHCKRIGQVKRHCSVQVSKRQQHAGSNAAQASSSFSTRRMGGGRY